MRLVPGHAVRRLGVVGTVALVFTASGLAYVCHPDLPGTHSLGVGGRVDAYALSGGRVTIHAWVRGCERTIVWRPTASASSAGGCTRRAAATLPRRAAGDGRHRVVLIPGSRNPDLPDRLAVYDTRTGIGLHAWPLPASASSVDVARGLAVLSTSNGVYVLRLRDGRFALLGVKRQGDRPQIGSAGVVFNDDLYKRRSAGRSLLKFMPFATVTHALRPFGPLRVPATIGDFSLDGRSVIFVKKDPTGECDHIGVWTIPWHYSTDLMDEPPICPERHAAGGIEALALGGQYVEILTRYGNVQTLDLEHVRPLYREGRHAHEARRRCHSGDCGRRFDARVRRPDGHESDSNRAPGRAASGRHGRGSLRRQAVGRPRSARRARCRGPHRRAAGRPRAADVRADRGSGAGAAR